MSGAMKAMLAWLHAPFRQDIPVEDTELISNQHWEPLKLHHKHTHTLENARKDDVGENDTIFQPH